MVIMNIMLFYNRITQEAKMEIRTLRYFLAVAHEENMSHAAEVLHVTPRDSSAPS